MNPEPEKSEALAEDSSEARTPAATAIAAAETTAAPAAAVQPPAAEELSQLESSPRLFLALKNRDYAYLWYGSFLSNIGTWMQNVALGWLVLQLSNSAFWLGAVSFASAAPMLVFTLVGGVISDTVDKRKLLIRTQIAMMFCAFLLAILTFYKVVTVPHIVVLAFATGVATSLMAPASQALLPQLVSRDELTNAVGLNSAQFNMSRVIGPMLGGFAMMWFGVAGNFLLNGLSFLAFIFALTRANVPKHVAVLEAGIWASLKEGFNYMLDDRNVRVQVRLVCVAALFGVPYLSFTPVFARDVLNVDERGLGLLMAFSGLGAFFGAVTIAYLGKLRRRGRLIFASGLLFFGSIVGFCFSRDFLLSSALLLVAGYTMIVMIATINTRLQLLTADHMRGRVMSIYATAYLGLPPIGAFFAGMFTRWIPVSHVIALMAVCGVALFSALYFASPELRELD